MERLKMTVSKTSWESASATIYSDTSQHLWVQRMLHSSVHTLHYQILSPPFPQLIFVRKPLDFNYSYSFVFASIILSKNNASQSGSHFDNKKGHWTLGASKGKWGSWRPDTYRPPLTSTQLCFLRRTEVPGRQGWSLFIGGQCRGSRTEGSWAQPPLSPHGPWWLRSGLGEPLGWGWGWGAVQREEMEPGRQGGWARAFGRQMNESMAAERVHEGWLWGRSYGWPGREGGWRRSRGPGSPTPQWLEQQSPWGSMFAFVPFCRKRVSSLRQYPFLYFLEISRHSFQGK